MRDLTGERFGGLTVIGFYKRKLTRTESPKRWGNFWRCRCRCGRKVVVGQSQLTGRKMLCCGYCHTTTHINNMENIDRSIYCNFLSYFDNNRILFEYVFNKKFSKSNAKREWEELCIK